MMIFFLMAGYVITKTKITFFAFAAFTIWYYAFMIFNKEKKEQKIFTDVILYGIILILTKAADLAIRSRLLVHIAKYLPNASYSSLAALAILAFFVAAVFYFAFHNHLHELYDWGFAQFHKIFTWVTNLIEHKPNTAISLGFLLAIL